MEIKKKILVIFPNEWLSYTPSLINLVEKLSFYFDVKVHAIDDGYYNNNLLNKQEFCFIRIDKKLTKLILALNKLSISQGNIKISGSKIYQVLKAILIYLSIWKIKNRYIDYEVIAVDSMGLFIAQKLFDKYHFISLEPYKDYFFRKANLTRIESVIAHSDERYNHLFGDTEQPIKKFIVPNSPYFLTNNQNLQNPLKPVRGIYFGNATPRNGLYFCLDAIRGIKHVGLTVKGKISDEDRQRILEEYRDLIKSGQLQVDNGYLQQEEIVKYLSKFWFGFCFYDFSHVDEVTRFNFESVPSGKMFNYYAAGVPVIGSDILGLKSVKDFNAGVLLEKPTQKSISYAIDIVLKEHDKYRNNCLKAAEYFDFDKAVQPFKNYLLSK